MDFEEQYEEFPCDICGSAEAVEVPHAREYTNNQPIHICKGCGFVYVKSRRSAKAIAGTWSKKLFGNHFYTANIPAVKARQVYAADFININLGLKDKEVFDIGAGEGQFLEILRREYGARVFGIEPSEANCQKLNALDVKNFNGTIEEYCAFEQHKHDKADIVTIIWTLENCRSCRDMLAGAYAILKDDGYVAIETGSRILVPFKKPLHYYLNANPADVNSFRFSANTLRGILAVSGFAITHLNRYLDTDVLCAIAQKRPTDTKISWEGDDYKQVLDFFERWHKESSFYR